MVMKENPTADTITDDQNCALRAEAATGDEAQVMLCDRALDKPRLLDSSAPASHREMNIDARKHARDACQLCADAINAARAQAPYEASLTKAIKWARSAKDGEYLVEYKDTGMTPAQDPGSRCGYGDQELASIDLELRERDLRLIADDRGLVAQAVRS